MFVTKLIMKFPATHVSIHARKISMTAELYSKKWRVQNGFPVSWRMRGILVDGPDYSFVDGRPTPYVGGQRKRLLQQKEFTEKAIKLLNIISDSKKQYQEKLQEEEEINKSVLSRKLKWKGTQLSPTESFETRKNKLRWSYARQRNLII